MKMMIRNVAVIGFGSQGRAQAVRLRKSGVGVTVGLRVGSRSRNLARRMGFQVAVPNRAVVDCDAVALLVPDRVARLVLMELEPHLTPGCAVVFAAGYPMVFPDELSMARDLVLVAPHGSGRELQAGRRMSGFVGVVYNATGRALTRARLYAHSIGLKPLYVTTPRLEALGDLFGEQALLCGGFLGLASAVASVMVRKGIPESHAYFETVGQMEQLSRLLAERGVKGFWEEISDCAASGAAQASPRLFGPGFAQALEKLWGDIESGRFARRFQERGRPAAYPREWKILERLEGAGRVPKGPLGEAGRKRKERLQGVGRIPNERLEGTGRKPKERHVEASRKPKKKGGRRGHPS